MKTLTETKLRELAGDYYSPEGAYQFVKSLPFLGTLHCSAVSLTAGQWTEITIEYTVGGSGLADGAWIKGTFKFYSVSTNALKLLGRHLTAYIKLRTGRYSKHRIPLPTIMFPRNMSLVLFSQARILPLSRIFTFDSTRKVTNDHTKKQSL